jgi:hypothetical protein
MQQQMLDEAAQSQVGKSLKGLIPQLKGSTMGEGRDHGSKIRETAKIEE